MHTSHSDGAPESDGDLRAVVRKKILHYSQLYINVLTLLLLCQSQLTLQSVTTMTLVVLVFLHTHREASTLANELPEESLSGRLSRSL